MEGFIVINKQDIRVVMLKNIILFISLLVFASGCANKQMLKQQIAEVIKENPQLLLDVMRENNIEVLTIVESGLDSRREKTQQDRFQEEIDNPLKPIISADRASIGNPDAPVTIVEYSDFLCPYCGKGAKVARDLVESNPEKYRLIYKHLPLKAESKKLSAVFEAIALIDKDKAFKFHDEAFKLQKELYKDPEGKVLGRILLGLDIDLDKLQEVLQSKKIAENLANDEAEAEAFGLNATPTFLINGVSIRGYVPADKFEMLIGVILEKSSQKEPVDGEVCEDCLNKM